MAPPIAVLMSFELATYGLVAGAVRRASLRWRAGDSGAWRRVVSEYGWLLAAIVAGRVVLGVAAALVGPPLGLRVSALAYVRGALLTGLPGVAVQLTLLPVLVARLGEYRERSRSGVAGGRHTA